MWQYFLCSRVSGHRGSTRGAPNLPAHTQTGLFRRLENFEQSGSTHTATDTHGDDDVAHAAAFAFDQRVADHAGTRHAVGVTDRNRTAVDVELGRIDAETITAVDGLRCEGFVEFPQAK